MNRLEKGFWELKINSRERRELLLVVLLLTVSMFLLNATFKRVADEAVIRVTEATMQKILRG